MAKNPSFTTITEPFILSYPTLLKPEPYIDPETKKPKGDPTFNFEALSDKESLANWQILDKDSEEFVRGNVEKRLVALAKERWGADFDMKVAAQHNDPKWPFKSGDKKADAKGEKAAHYRDKKFWRAKALSEINGSYNEPALYDGSGGQLVKLIRSTEAGKQRINELFYPGAICTAEINWVANEFADKKHLTAYVNAVVFEEDGERIGGGSRMEQLRGVKGGQTTYDPTEGMATDLDDEIDY